MEEIMALYKFHGKDLAVEIKNETDQGITISTIHLLHDETSVVLAKEPEIKYLQPNEGRGFYFRNVTNLLENMGFDRSSLVFVRCKTSDGKQYDNLKIQYSKNLTF